MILDMVRKITSGAVTWSAGMFNGQAQRNFDPSNILGLGIPQTWAQHVRSHRGPVNALRNPTVYRCIRGTIQVLSTLPVRSVDRESKETIRTPQSDLMAFPNDEQTGVEFWEMMYANLLSHGNAFAQKVYIRGQVKMLLPMSALKVTVERRDGVKLYRYMDLPGEIFQARDILHLRWFGPDDLTGLSPLWVAENIIRLDQRQEDMLIGNAEEGGQPGLIIQIPPEKALDRIHAVDGGSPLNDKTTIQYQLEQARTRLALYLPAGYIGTPLAANYRDQQVSETRDANVAALARIWGYPLSKLGVLSKSDNASTVEQADLAWFKDELRPIITKTEKRCEMDLMTESERKRFQMKVNTRAVLQGDMEAQTQQDVQLWQIGAVTTNEIRDWRDLPAYADPAADKPHWPVNMSTENIAGANQSTNPADGGVPPARALPIFEDAMGRIVRKECAVISRAVKSITDTGGMDVNLVDRVRELYAAELLPYIELQLQAPAQLMGGSAAEWARGYVLHAEEAFRAALSVKTVATWIETRQAPEWSKLQARECLEHFRSPALLT